MLGAMELTIARGKRKRTRKSQMRIMEDVEEGKQRLRTSPGTAVANLRQYAPVRSPPRQKKNLYLRTTRVTFCSITCRSRRSVSEA